MTLEWNNYYVPPNVLSWQGRADTPENSAFFQIVRMNNLLEEATQVLRQNALNENKSGIFGLVGFCCDEGVRRNFGRVGAAEGPKALRHALAKLPVHRNDFAFYDCGDVICNNENLEEAQHVLGEVVAKLLSAHVTPIVIGGGHEVAWGHYQGIAHAFPKTNLGIVNFDAHLDMRRSLQGSSGTPFLQIAQDCEKHNRRFDYNCIGVQTVGNSAQLFETAKKYNVKTILAENLHQNELQKSVEFIQFVDRVIEQNESVYLTLCLDVFSAGFAPGVSAVQPLGLSPWHVIPFIRQIARSGKLVSFDIAELCPRYDTDDRTAKLAACLVHEVVHYIKIK